MIKELVLIPRTLWSLASLVLFATCLPFPLRFGPGLTIFALILGFSFMFQYFVHYYAMKNMQTIRSRRIYMLAWLVISPLIVAWGMLAIANVDYSQGETAALNDFAWSAMIFVQGASILVGTVCTRRAFERHHAL